MLFGTSSFSFLSPTRNNNGFALTRSILRRFLSLQPTNNAIYASCAATSPITFSRFFASSSSKKPITKDQLAEGVAEFLKSNKEEQEVDLFRTIDAISHLETKFGCKLNQEQKEYVEEIMSAPDSQVREVTDADFDLGDDYDDEPLAAAPAKDSKVLNSHATAKSESRRMRALSIELTTPVTIQIPFGKPMLNLLLPLQRKLMPIRSHAMARMLE
eukprot:GEZU01013120.1.p1 GENE.GEZU01013120.1~~GEZU01013120.1.p1  ORF type:complete len:215 (-),score=12.65 GEZU01013120.1:288-932(-)